MICLSFDTDYMTSQSIEMFFSRNPIPGKGTFFLWKPFPNADWGRHEIQPHPYVDDLTKFGSNLDSFVDSLAMAQAPQGVRTHSCVMSHMVGIDLSKRGYKYASMSSLLFETGLKPYRHPWGIWEMPIYYMDNMDYCMPENWPNHRHKPFSPELIHRALNNEGMFIFDFHPLHIALNTTSYEGYQGVKASISRGEDPHDLRMSGRGVAVYFQELCEAIDKAGVVSIGLGDALNSYLANNS